MEIKVIKKEAKSYLKGNWGTAIGSMFIMGLIVMAINFVVSMVSGLSTMLQMIPLSYMENSEEAMLALIPAFIGSLGVIIVFSIVVALVQQLLSVGYKWALLDLIDGKNYSVGSLFQGFNRASFKTLGLIIMMGIFTGLWSLLFIVPGIIKSYSYSQALNILKDNPEIGIMDAITASRKLMDGKKGQLFVLQLTFILWYVIPVIVLILVIVLLGALGGSNESNGFFLAFALLGYFALMIYILVINFYIYPYLTTSEQNFYRHLTDVKIDEKIAEI